MGFQNKFYNASKTAPGPGSGPDVAEYVVNMSTDTPHWYIRDYLARVSGHYDIRAVQVDGQLIFYISNMLSWLYYFNTIMIKLQFVIVLQKPWVAGDGNSADGKRKADFPISRTAPKIQNNVSASMKIVSFISSFSMEKVEKESLTHAKRLEYLFFHRVPQISCWIPSYFNTKPMLLLFWKKQII